jgi:enoyl-CoA hydratase/carnithine racemase
MAESQHLDNVLYEVKDRVAIITMNRPERLNAVGLAMREDILRAMHAADEDDEVRCMILTGSGRAFSSGGDIAEPGGRTSVATHERTAWDWYTFFAKPHADGARLTGRAVYKPLIAAVNGICYGGGLIAAMQCDIIIASDQARFCMIESRMGATGSTYLPYHVGPQWAKLLMLTGEIITARRAERIGLAALVVPHAQLLERALTLGKRIAAMPRYGVMLNKANIDGTMDMMGWLATGRFSDSHGAVVQGMTAFAETADGTRLADLRGQGVRAFVQARDAAFTESLLPEDWS